MGNCTSAQPKVDYNTAPTFECPVTANQICRKVPHYSKFSAILPPISKPVQDLDHHIDDGLKDAACFNNHELLAPPPPTFRYAPPKPVPVSHNDDWLNSALKDAGKNNHNILAHHSSKNTAILPRYNNDQLETLSKWRHKQDIIEELENKNHRYTKALIHAAIKSVPNEEDPPDIGALTEYIDALMKQREEEEKNDDFSNKLSSMVGVHDHIVEDIILEMDLGDGGNNGLPAPNDDDNALSDADDAPVAFRVLLRKTHHNLWRQLER